MAFYKPLLFYLIAIVSGPIIVPPVIRPAGPGIYHVFFLQCLTAFLARAGLSKVSPIVSMRKNFFFEIDKYFDILTYSTFKHNELLKSSTQKKSSYPISVLRTIVLPYKGSENLRFQRSLLFMIIIILITNLA